jgi:hypothetical protein
MVDSNVLLDLMTERHALAFMVGRGCRKSSRSVSPRYQPDNLRRGLYSLFAHRGSGGGTAESNVGPRSNPYEAAFLAEKFSRLSATRRNKAITASGLFISAHAAVAGYRPLARRCAVIAVTFRAVVDRPAEPAHRDPLHPSQLRHTGLDPGRRPSRSPAARSPASRKAASWPATARSCPSPLSRNPATCSYNSEEHFVVSDGSVRPLAIAAESG